MLRLKKLRRQGDPTSTTATKFVAQRTSERHRRSMGTMDERSRPTAGRRSIRWRVCTMHKESDIARAGRMGARKHRRKWVLPAVDLEARAELELRHAGARSTSEP